MAGTALLVMAKRGAAFFFAREDGGHGDEGFELEQNGVSQAMCKQ